jgi:hypothetical protein
MVGGAGLQPPRAATTLRQPHGKRRVQDGPFVETKEQLGGYYVVDVPKTLGRTSEARESYDRAIGLSEDPAVRAFLAARSRA